MNDNGLIRNLGVYGYDEVEPLILAALVTGGSPVADRRSRYG
jgi:hypothetical protein